jgi:hypothetical protein
MWLRKQNRTEPKTQKTQTKSKKKKPFKKTTPVK